MNFQDLESLEVDWNDGQRFVQEYVYTCTSRPRPLRSNEFTIKLAEGGSLSVDFLKNISWLFKQNLTFSTNQHCLNPILKNSNEKATISLQNRVFGRRNKFGPIQSNLDYSDLDYPEFSTFSLVSHEKLWPRKKFAACILRYISVNSVENYINVCGR